MVLRNCRGTDCCLFASSFSFRFIIACDYRRCKSVCNNHDWWWWRWWFKNIWNALLLKCKIIIIITAAVSSFTSDTRCCTAQYGMCVCVFCACQIFLSLLWMSFSFSVLPPSRSGNRLSRSLTRPVRASHGCHSKSALHACIHLNKKKIGCVCWLFGEIESDRVRGEERGCASGNGEWHKNMSIKSVSPDFWWNIYGNSMNRPHSCHNWIVVIIKWSHDTDVCVSVSQGQSLAAKTHTTHAVLFLNSRIRYDR